MQRKMVCTALLALLFEYHAHAQFIFLRARPDDYFTRWKDRKFNPYKGPNPLVVLLEIDPTRLVLGTDNPDLVLYENGDLVLFKRTKKRAFYVTRKLSDAELKDFIKRVAPLRDLKGLRPFYDVAPRTTNQFHTCFLFHTNDKLVVTQIRGLETPDSDEDLAKLPPEILAAAKSLRSVDGKDSAMWKPKYVEVMLWPWRKVAPEEAIPWPKEWPGLKSERALKGRDFLSKDDFYSVFLDAKLLPQVEKVLAPDVDAIRLAERKWMFAYRYVFPGEPIWRKPFFFPEMNKK